MIVTKEQRLALLKLYKRTADPVTGAYPTTYRQFRRTVLPGYECLMVPLWGMWLGIEKDGYVHS